MVGTISTRRVLDHDLERRVYHVIVAASADESSAALPSNTSDVIVYVTDVNDNSPVFDFPSPSNDTVYLSNHLQSG